VQTRPSKPLVIMMTGFGSVESAVSCMKDGAFDYMLKPFSSEQIDVTLKKADEFTQLIKVNRFLTQDDGDESGYELLGRSPAMEQVRQLIRKVARTQATVLIQGESGTGKELVARAIYRESPRQRAIHPRQLRRRPGKPDRERILRPRERRVHRRDEQTRRPL
jgi:DNA-binding NtrC family response regulator